MVKSQGAELRSKGRALNWFVWLLKKTRRNFLHLGARNVKISVLQVKTVGPHSWKECSSDGLCRLHLEMLGFELVHGLKIDDQMKPSEQDPIKEELARKVERALRPFWQAGSQSIPERSLSNST